MTKNEFKVAVEGLWECFRRSVCIINTLEDIGLTVEPGSEKFGLPMLYGIQDAMAKSVMNILGIDNTELLGEVDCFLVESADNVTTTEGFSEELFEELLRIIKAYGYELPWEGSCEVKFKEDDPVVKHRALARGRESEVVRGYIWEGADHAYIIPENSGIAYDEETSTLTAHAVEVDKATIAAEAHVLDSGMRRLFYGDTVRLGDAEFVIKPMDPATVRLLSVDRKGKELHVIKPNYE